VAADTSPGAPIGYYHGIDLFLLGAAADELGRRLTEPGGEPLERWQPKAGEATIDTITQRVATGAMFGGGTLVVLEPVPYLRSKESRTGLLATIEVVAPGNALAFVDPVDSLPTERRPLDAGRSALRAAVASAGGEFRIVPALTQGGLTRFIEAQAQASGVRLGRGAAQVLAERLGGFIREGDVDRDRLGQMAASEVARAGLYRLDAEVSPDDIRAIVPEVIPSSLWGLTDAVGMRRADAMDQLERALAVTPEPVLVVILHRRIRELLELADRTAAGATLQSAARAMKLHEFRARTLDTQARRWTPAELELALAGLLELDATIKGSGDGGSGERARQLGFTLWLSEFVIRA
jgi:DNA polymerase III delta subunit